MDTGGWPTATGERQQTKDDKEVIEMARIEASVVINRPIEEVFAYMIDFEKTDQWSAQVVETKKTSEGPVGVGTRFVAVARVLGRRIEDTVEVTEYEPNSKYSLKHAAGPISIEKDEFTFESVAGGIKVTHVFEMETGGFFRLAEPLVARMIRRQSETDFAHLKDLLEAQA